MKGSARDSRDQSYPDPTLGLSPHLCPVMGHPVTIRNAWLQTTEQGMAQSGWEALRGLCTVSAAWPCSEALVCFKQVPGDGPRSRGIWGSPQF